MRAELNPVRPHFFFPENEPDESGIAARVATLILVNRRCPWCCIYCDLWKNTVPATVPLGAIPAQIDYALEQLAGSNARQIKLYNAGSFFDPKAIPPGDFPAIAERVRSFERVIVECHPALVGESAVAFQTLLGPNTHLEVAMGLEIADDAILARLNKRMTLAMFARAAEFLRDNQIALRAFVIVKPPFVRTEEEALAQAQRSIEFAFDCGATAVSLIPARLGTPELDALAAAGEFSPPKLTTVELALDRGLALQRGRVFVDLWDLKKIASCAECFHQRRARLEAANLRQQPPPAIHCEACAMTRP